MRFKICVKSIKYRQKPTLRTVLQKRKKKDRQTSG